MTLLTDLQQYAASKRNYGNSAIKKIFFEQIIELIKTKKLTVATLTDKLASLPDEIRQQLFFLRRRHSASINSEAAQWIKTLYNLLNIPLDDLSLAIIVAEGITDNNKSILKKVLLEQWQKNPLSSKNINHLERELKGYLFLNNDDNQALTLAQAMKNNIVMHGFVNLEPMLTTLADVALPYLPDLLNQLCQQFQTEKTQCFAQLLAFAKKHPHLVSSMTLANADLAAALVHDQPTIFFTLSDSMQQLLLARFQQYNDQAMVTTLLACGADDPVLGANVQSGFAQLLSDRAYRLAASQDATHPAHQLWCQYHQTIVKKLPMYNAQLLAQDRKSLALKTIDNYLYLQPNAYKSQFFERLKQVISVNGLTTELLSEYLQATNRSLLFAKWSGKEQSRAAAVMRELYRQATFGQKLTATELNTMVNDGVLPKRLASDVQRQQQAYLNSQVASLLIESDKIDDSNLGCAVKREIHYYQSYQRLSQHKFAMHQARAEAMYQAYLIKKGLQEASKQTPIIFDPQGHVLVNVTLDQTDLNELLSAITGQAIEQGSLDVLAQHLGSTNLGATTLCNLDIIGQHQLTDLFKRQLLGDKPSDILNKAVLALVKATERHSIIALQEEMTLHILLCLRVLEQVGQGYFEPLTANERHALIAEINTHVLMCFRQVLVQSYQNNTLDVKQLNKLLDKSRKKLSSDCRTTLVAHIRQKINNTEQLQAFSEQGLALLTDKLFMSTSATGLDYLRTDAINHIATRISGTNYTSHNKMLGAEKQGLRLLSRNHYDAARQVVRPQANLTQEARVPSIADIHQPHRYVVNDVAEKLGYSASLLRLKNPAYQGPIIYNLLTSLHTIVYDNSFFEMNNRQRQSAERILLGAHQYNAQQVGHGGANSFIYVQNIPVNQHTHRLTYQTIDNVKGEVTLMADMALLATFNHYSALFPPSLAMDIANTYQQAQCAYTKFLTTDMTHSPYFRETAGGKAVIRLLKEKKASWSLIVPTATVETDLHALFVKALFKMTADNAHHITQFGMLVQTLSIVIEPISQAGCKSANERYPCAAGRVELLKSMVDTPHHCPQKQALINVLTGFVMGRATLSDVQERLDKTYNHYNLQGSASVFSEDDQSAATKINATENKANPGVITELSSNYSETGYLTYLYQKFSATMQTHKAKLSSLFRGLFAKEVESCHAHTSSHFLN